MTMCARSSADIGEEASQPFFSCLISSFSTASRMNSARLPGPFRASIRSGCPSSSRTTVGFTSIPGLPRLFFATFFMFTPEKAISIIDGTKNMRYRYFRQHGRPT